RLHEETGLVHVDERVGGAVHDEEVGGVRGDPQDRRGSLVGLGGVRVRRLHDPLGQVGVAHRDGTAQAGGPGEVVHAVDGGGGLHARVRLLEAGLVLGVV